MQNYRAGRCTSVGGGGGRQQLTTGEAPVQGTVETDPSPPVQCPPGQQRDIGVGSMLMLSLVVCQIPFLNVCYVINDHLMLLSCACPVCRVSLWPVKDAQTNGPEREAIACFELGLTCIHLPSLGFPVLVG